MRVRVSHLIAIAVFCWMGTVPSGRAEAGLMSTDMLLDSAVPAGEAAYDPFAASGASVPDVDPVGDVPAVDHQTPQSPALWSPAGSTGSMSGSPSAASGAAGGLAADLAGIVPCPPLAVSGCVRQLSALRPSPPCPGGIFHPPRETSAA